MCRRVTGFNVDCPFKVANSSLQGFLCTQLQVVNTTPQIELKIVSDTLNQFIGKSLTLVGKNIDISSLFQNMSQTTPPLLQALTPTSRSVIESFFTLQQTDIGNKGGGAVIKQLLEITN